jgi:hypothetical protein
MVMLPSIYLDVLGKAATNFQSQYLASEPRVKLGRKYET